MACRLHWEIPSDGWRGSCCRNGKQLGSRENSAVPDIAGWILAFFGPLFIHWRCGTSPETLCKIDRIPHLRYMLPSRRSSLGHPNPSADSLSLSSHLAVETIEQQGTRSPPKNMERAWFGLPIPGRWHIAVPSHSQHTPGHLFHLDRRSPGESRYKLRIRTEEPFLHLEVS